MPLIKSISGIRGTIGGKTGESLSPVDIIKFSAAYGTWVKKRNSGRSRISVVVGRDARKSGNMVSGLVVSSLRSLGINIIDLGMATTPTVEIAVTGTHSQGGVIITASHNPENWNALKLLNEKGEFLSAHDGAEVLELASNEKFEFVLTDSEGEYLIDDTWNQKHINQILDLDLVDIETIRKAKLSVAVDCINSVGGIVVPLLLKSLGVNKVTGLNMVPDGNFAHNPEPLPENLKDISEFVSDVKADLGFVVDPDVDRLAIVCEDGSMFGEEYTLVAVSDYILKHTPGSTVSNLSSTRALKDVSAKYGCSYFSSSVGEVNVVEEMKRVNAVIGGEGNGGVIYPALHYGRDALVGIALFLTHLAKSSLKCSELRSQFPDYFISKKKMVFEKGQNFREVSEAIKKEFPGCDLDERDGIRIDLSEGWVQIRKSNTEQIIRIYAERRTMQEADSLSERVIEIVKKH